MCFNTPKDDFLYYSKSSAEWERLDRAIEYVELEDPDKVLESYEKVTFTSDIH